MVLALLAGRADSDKIEGTQYGCLTVKALIATVRETDLLG